MEERYLVPGTGLIVFELQVFDLLGDQRIGVGDDLHVPILLLVEIFLQGREIIQISVHLEELLERLHIPVDVADVLRYYIYVVRALDIDIIEIELREVCEEIRVREESEIVLRFDSDIDHIIEPGPDEPFSDILRESAEDLLELEIVSGLIIGIVSGGDDAASVIEELGLRRDDLRLREELYVLDALQLRHLLHAVELAEMLIDDRGHDADEFLLVPDEFGIDEDIIHRDVVGELDMFIGFIVGEDIPSLRFERCLADVLLIEERIVIAVPQDLEVEQSEDEDEEEESEKAEEIELPRHPDESQKGIGLQPMLQSLIEILIVIKRFYHAKKQE